MGFQCFIHQMKGIIFLYMLIYLILRKNKRKQIYMERCFFYFYFSIVHISSNNVIGSLNVCKHVSNIHVEGTVSQIFFPYHSFFVKKRVTFYFIFKYFFIHFMKKKLGPISTI